MSRIDTIGQNGNDGLHYLVEDIAKMIYEDWHVTARYSWEDFVPLAMKVIERVRDE